MKTPPGPTRGLCFTCLRSPENCLCQHLRRFDPGIRFVILIHGREARKHIATGRLAHLCLEGSRLIRGYDYQNDEQLDALLAEPRSRKAVLYPGDGSTNLSRLAPNERAALFPPPAELVLFVIDGTWTTARKTMSRNAKLAALPRFSLDPPTPSRIRLRQQPEAHCITTAEAIHETIELLGPGRGFAVSTRAHDTLLDAQAAMVDKQVALARSHFAGFWA